MSFENSLKVLGTQEAAADLSTHQFKGVKLDATGKVILASVDGELLAGVLQNNPLLGRTALVGYGGVVQWKASAAVAAGAFVSTDNAGLVKTAVATKYIAGIALKAAAGAGEVIPVLFVPQGVHA